MRESAYEIVNLYLNTLVPDGLYIYFVVIVEKLQTNKVTEKWAEN